MAKTREAKRLVDACGYNIYELFTNQAFSLGFFQREYVWEDAQVKKLLSDLAEKFLAQWSQEHSDQDVVNYDPYFLGPFIVYTVNGRTHLADGQQRIITLLVLLIFLHRLTMAQSGPQANMNPLPALIRSYRLGRPTFSVDVDEYSDCFDALLNGRELDTESAPANVRRVWAAYQCIDAHYPFELRGEVLGMFVHWLLQRVSLIAMDAGDYERAAEMYQSMNDRGVRLSPMDHLKQYLLSDADTDPRALEGMWNTMVSTLEKVERGAAFGYIRAFFRARYPDIPHGPEPSLADATHEWVHEHRNEIWPNYKNGHRARLFTGVVYPLYSTYATLLRARSRLNQELRAVRFNAHNGITEQFDLTLAALRPEDPPPVRTSKAAMVANFLDLFYVTQTLDDEEVEQKHIDELVSEVMPAVQRCGSREDDLRRVLGEHAVDWPDRLARIPELRYGVKNRFVHYVLTRLTAWIEVGAGGEDPTERLLIRRPGEQGFEIEHLFPRNPTRYAHLVPDAQHYSGVRDRIGALLLLDGPENRTYGDLPLAEKLKRYRSSSLLGGMLNADFFQRGNRAMWQFLLKQHLRSFVISYDESAPLEPFIDARGRLYHEMARRVWGLAELKLAPPAGAAPVPVRKRSHHGIRVADLVMAGLVEAGDRLVGHRKGKPYFARVLADGRLQTASGSASVAPTRAMMDAVGVASNGWAFWRVERTGELLSAVRERYLGDLAC